MAAEFRQELYKKECQLIRVSWLQDGKPTAQLGIAATEAAQGEPEEHPACRAAKVMGNGAASAET